MAIDAIYLHEDGYKYNLVYATKSKFLSSVRKMRNAVFVNAVDYAQQEIIYPSNLPDYAARRCNRKSP